jgi:hypothetical protein
VRGNEARSERTSIATVCLIKRALPEKPPPRIIVLTGQSRGPRPAACVTRGCVTQESPQSRNLDREGEGCG